MSLSFTRFLFKRLEALAIHARGFRHARKGVGVNVTYAAQHVLHLVFTHHGKQYVRLLLRIKTLGVQERHPTVHLGADHFGYFLVFVGGNEHLHARLRTHHDEVYRVGRHRHDHKAVQHDPQRFLRRFPKEIVENEERRRDDAEVAVKDDPTRADVVVFGDNQRHDVGAARAAAVVEGRAHRQPDERAADNGRQERVLIQNRLFEQPLPKRYEKRQEENGPYRFETERIAEDFKADEQQDGVDDEGRDTDRNPVPRGIVQQRGDTVHAAADDVRVDDEHHEREGVEAQTERDNDVTLYLTLDLLLIQRLRRKQLFPERFLALGVRLFAHALTD